MNPLLYPTPPLNEGLRHEQLLSLISNRLKAFVVNRAKYYETWTVLISVCRWLEEEYWETENLPRVLNPEQVDEVVRDVLRKRGEFLKEELRKDPWWKWNALRWYLRQPIQTWRSRRAVLEFCQIADSS